MYAVSRLFGLRWAPEHNESSLRDDTPESGQKGNGSVTRALPVPLPSLRVSWCNLNLHIRYGGISLRSNYKCESGATGFQRPPYISFLFYPSLLSTYLMNTQT